MSSIAQSLALTASASLAGSLYTMSTVAVPAVLAGPTNAPLLVEQWNTMFRAGSKIGPTLVGLGMVNYLFVAWRAYRRGEGRWGVMGAAGVGMGGVAG